MGIIGFLYGSLVGTSPDRSYVEMEFELAVERKMDCLVFLLDPESGRLGPPATAINKQDAEHKRRQDSFRARLAQNDKRASVESPDDTGDSPRSHPRRQGGGGHRDPAQPARARGALAAVIGPEKATGRDT